MGNVTGTALDFTALPVSPRFQSKRYLNIGLWNECAKTYIAANTHVDLDSSHSLTWSES